tara:strand:- start:13 stop:789 length:777 start_codon:yes stop_codon:yes gene_type:complete
MIKDFLISFRDNFKEKTRNPFLGTYLIVWMIRNWELIFTIFNFDDDYKLENKIEFVNSYYTEHSFLGNLFSTILWAFGVLILTYLLLAITRFITNLSEKQLIPWIYKVTDNKSIVLKETYDNLRVENVRNENQLEKERENKRRLIAEISELEKVIDDLKNIGNENKEELTRTKSLENEVDLLFEKIKDKNLTDDYIEIVNRIGEAEQGWIDNEHWSSSTDYFVRLGLLHSGKRENNYSELSISTIGEKVLRRARLELD